MPASSGRARSSILPLESLMSPSASMPSVAGPTNAGHASVTTAAAASGMPASKEAQSEASKRKSRPLQRKTSHSLIERRRREKINEGLISLQSLVPACRDELRETLRTKAHSVKKNARKAKAIVDDDVERDLDAKIDTQMVLEKLCIISHTVDYVQELQQKLQAYRRICRCSPPLMNDIDDIHVQGTHDHAHSQDDEEEAGEIDSLGDASYGGEGSSSEVDELEGDTPALVATKHPQTVSPSGSKPMAPTAQVQHIHHTHGHTRCHAKCQRHWGSNNPIKLAHGSTHIASDRRARSRSDSDKPAQRAIAVTEPPAAARYMVKAGPRHSQYDAHECCNESDSSDLELDAWKPVRRVPDDYTHSEGQFVTVSPQKRTYTDSQKIEARPKYVTSLSSGALHYESAHGAEDALEDGPQRKRAHTTESMAERETGVKTHSRSRTTSGDCGDCFDGPRVEQPSRAAQPPTLPSIQEMLAPTQLGGRSKAQTPSALGLLADLSARRE